MSDVEKLTEIYMDVSQGTESTIEQQEEQRGTWQPTVGEDAESMILETIVEMRNRYGLDTKLSDDQLVTLVQAYFEGESDSEIARKVGDASLDKTVTRARLSLHLFRASDTEATFDVEGLRDCFEAGHSGAECARQIGIGKSTANRYRRIFEAKAAADSADHEYYDRFERYCRGETNDDGDGGFDDVGIEDDPLHDAVDGAGADNPQLQ